MRMALEAMDAFFEARLEGYEDHMLQAIDGAGEFYPFTAAQLPTTPGAKLLDLGCGTGLELDWYFPRNPTAQVTGIDLSAKMLAVLQDKHAAYHLDLICGNYFDVPFGEGVFDCAVSVESLHHFTQAEKLPLYQKLCRSLKPGGYFLLTDYFALSKAEEQQHRHTFLALLQAQQLPFHAIYHYDTPLTVAHEQEVLLSAGFSTVEVLGSWGATHTLKAVRQ